MKLHRLASLLALAAIATSPTMSHAIEPATQTEDYVAGFLGDAELNICADDSPVEMNIDQVCFDVTAGRSYRVDIADAVNGTHIGYLWTFRNAAGDCVGQSPDPLGGCPNGGLTCGTQTLGAPPTAVELTILLDGPVFGPLDCLVGGPGDSAGMGTTGTVTARRLA